MKRQVNHTPRASKPQPEPLRVVELFAGVGGFRIGLCGKNGKGNKCFSPVWFNQWEPSSRRQHAHEVYTARFPASVNEERDFTNTNIAEVVAAVRRGEFQIPHHDVLVGGFPCQDYSVARTLSQATGIAGKKGVLWWEIRNILELKQNEGQPVKYIFLENVDRLLKSPAKQRGRDFAVMLATLADLGYAVEWRVINAADYGMPQRRRRIFIVGYHISSPLYQTLISVDPLLTMTKKGVLASAFPAAAKIASPNANLLTGDFADVSENFNLETPEVSPFHSAGVMRGRQFYTTPVTAIHSGRTMTLGDILINEKDIPSEYFLSPRDLKQWRYLKGAKNEPRRGANGFEFIYTEGSMVFPDPLDKPSRTIITGEGGKTPSRFKHVVKTKSGKYRRLTPIELERLCMFPDNHTGLQEISDIKRAFFMGNALVVGVIERIGKKLFKLHNDSLKHSLNAPQRRTPSPLRSKSTRPNNKVLPTSLS